MGIPLNSKGAPGATYSRSVQFGLAEGVRRVELSRANPELWLLWSRLAFVYDTLCDSHPTLFRRRNYPLNPVQTAARLGLT